MSAPKLASDLPVPTYEASVSCGSYCQGGSVSFEAITYPEYTDLWQVWVKGTDVAALASSHAELLAALQESMIAMSAATAHLPVNELPRIACNTAIAKARAAIAKAKGLVPREQQK